MNRLTCPTCGVRVFFRDRECLSCGTPIAYDVTADDFVTADATCRHRDEWRCNWIAAAPGEQCDTCAMDVIVDGPADEIHTFQIAKRRVMRQLMRMGTDPSESDPPLRFELLHGDEDNRVIIGHADGLVTLDISEGDPAHLEKVRRRLGEPYRTPLGHVRHESGHWHWQAFVLPDELRLTQFRELFGDERADYSESLRRHYDKPDDGSWRDEYVTHYAAAHPWEDYAESFAHLLHMADMVETAVAEGFIEGNFRGITDVYQKWVPLTVSLNEMARSMGTTEPYPFSPPDKAVRKMLFTYDVINSSRQARAIGRP